jgi:hypothetical protein
MNTVTGRSVDLAFSWEKPSSSVTAYDIQIYTDEAGTTRIARHNVASTASTPVVLMGPFQAGTQTVEFSPGTTYYWKVRVSPRVAPNGPVYSQYSEMRSFTVEPAAAQVPNILSPSNGSTDILREPSFSWAPVSGASSYLFQLDDAADFAKTLMSSTVDSTGIASTVKLNYGMTYYWRVKPVAPVEGDWSAVANFVVMDAPVEPAPPVVVQEVPPPVINIPAPINPPAINIPPAPAPPAQIAPAYIWAIIIIGAVLVIAVIILIVRTRRAV